MKKQPVIKAETSSPGDDAITKGLLAFDPTEPEKIDNQMAPVLPKEEVIHDFKPASQLLKEFLETNNMELTVSPVTENLLHVSDGSIILSRPKILVNYRK